jgi:hypothetical protein
MKFEIVALEDLSGARATFYSVYVNDGDETLFDTFLLENSQSFKEELLVILQTIKQIAHKNGAKRSFFKENEGKLGDLVCALYDTPLSNLRLYCIRLGSAVVILGGGGHKPKDIRALQENEKLTHENALMRQFSTILYQKLKEGDIYWANDQELAGNLIIDTDE